MLSPAPFWRNEDNLDWTAGLTLSGADGGANVFPLLSHGTSHTLSLGRAEGCVRVRVRVSVCLWAVQLRAAVGVEMLGTSQTGFTFCYKCSGLMRCVHAPAAGAPGCMWFESTRVETISGFLFPPDYTVGLLTHEMKGCVSCIQILF